PRYEKWWRQFQFNEAIGFITLFPRKHAIRAEYCFVRQRPMAYLARKEFENQGKLFQVRASTTQNQVTLDRLLEALDNSTREGVLRPYWVDCGILECVGRHIDWLGLCGETN